MSCGHPTFMYRLPLDAQTKIREIWAHYEAGDECEKEKDATGQVIQSIPQEVRFKVFRGMCGQALTWLKYRRPMSRPAFLKDATPAARTQFQNVWLVPLRDLNPQIHFQVWRQIKSGGEGNRIQETCVFIVDWWLCKLRHLNCRGRLKLSSKNSTSSRLICKNARRPVKKQSTQCRRRHKKRTTSGTTCAKRLNAHLINILQYFRNVCIWPHYLLKSAEN